jgi:hypothetical protein
MQNACWLVRCLIGLPSQPELGVRAHTYHKHMSPQMSGHNDPSWSHPVHHPATGASRRIADRMPAAAHASQDTIAPTGTSAPKTRSALQPGHTACIMASPYGVSFKTRCRRPRSKPSITSSPTTMTGVACWPVVASNAWRAPRSSATLYSLNTIP